MTGVPVYMTPLRGSPGLPVAVVRKPMGPAMSMVTPVPATLTGATMACDSATTP